MEKYTVIHHFIDSMDNHHQYNADDDYPRTGEIDDKRVKCLETKNNRAGMLLIKKEKIEKKAKEKVENENCTK